MDENNENIEKRWDKKFEDQKDEIYESNLQGQINSKLNKFKELSTDKERKSVLEEIAKVEKIEITDADLEFEYAKIAEQYKMKVEDVKKALAANLGEFKNNLKMQRIDDLLYNENK